MAKRKYTREEQERRMRGIDQRAAERRIREGRALEGDEDLLTMALPTPEWENQRRKDPEQFQRLWKMTTAPVKNRRKGASEEQMSELTIEFWGSRYYCVGDAKRSTV